MKQLFYSLLSIQFLIACNSYESKRSATELTERMKQIDGLINQYHSKDRFHGEVVISHFGEFIYESYIGIADRTWNIPFDDDIKMDIASVNKSMIAALILKAEEEDLLSLDDRLVDLLANYSYQGSFHPDISLHNLLNQSSGIGDYGDLSDEFKKNNFRDFKRLHFTHQEYIDFISQIQVRGEPGDQFYYSNFGYHLLGIVLSNIYDQPFDLILKKKLTEPLGLKNTVSSNRNDITIPNLAKAYNLDSQSGRWLENNYIDLSLGHRIFSTASDLNRWAQVLNNPGWLSESSLDLMRRNYYANTEQNISYGYGWVVIEENDPKIHGNLGIDLPYIIHGGSTEGYKSMLINIDYGKYVISFLSNVGNQTNELELAHNIVKLLLK